MPNDNDFMQHAINLAKHAASQNEVPIGAIIVLNDQIIAEGWNQPIASNDPTAHAEIIVLRSAAQQLNNYRLLNTTLYVTLEPCLMCVGSMIHARIKQLVFGAYDPKSGAIQSVFKFLDSKKLNHSITYQGGVMEQKCGELLTTFFQKRRI
jgi:tRNA(adenine34) deaminase